jgi:hypothetical protein
MDGSASMASMERMTTANKLKSVKKSDVERIFLVQD